VTESTTAVTEIANIAITDRYTPKHETELHTSDGGVFVGKDRADIIANMQLRNHLMRRRERGRDPMVAELLGFFEGAAAWLRGEIAEYGAPLIKRSSSADGNGGLVGNGSEVVG
jgi:hypothetical protein